MDSTTTYIGIAVTSIAVLAATIAYYNMGCTTSSNPQITSQTGAISDKKKSASTKVYPAGKLSIYFGSQTGTAEGFARTIMEEGKDKGFEARMVDLEDFDPEELKDSKLVLFLVATYGEGDPTDNAAKFNIWQKNEDGEVPADYLSTVNFTVFGLGNRQYEHFNKMGKTTNKCLEKLGATRVFEYGEGDDDGTLEEDFDAWKSKLWTALINKFHPSASEAGGIGTFSLCYTLCWKLTFSVLFTLTVFTVESQRPTSVTRL